MKTTDQTPRLDPDVYRRAAERILTGKNLYTCNSIIEVMIYDLRINYSDDYIGFYRDWFHHHWNQSKLAWWNSPERTRENQETRALSLLLCADILESEQKGGGK